MENFALIALAENLKTALDGCIIRRIIQHQPNGFILQTRSPKLPGLKFFLDSRTPALYPSESRVPVDCPGSDFLMVLRKHFTSAELIEFKKPLSERIVEFVFRTAVPSKELETMSLVLELIPNAANLVLLDSERRVLSSLLPISPQHGIGDFEPYAFPTTGDKIDLERILTEDLPELQDGGDKDASWLIRHIAGLGPVFAEELLVRQRKSRLSLTDEIRKMVDQLRTPSLGGRIYTEKPLGHILEQNDLRSLTRAIISPIELLSLERTHSAREFGKITEAARFYFDEVESRSLLEHAKLPVLRDLRSASKRLEERDKRLNREQARYEEAEGLQKTGQLLSSSGKKLDGRYETVTVTDYFGETPRDLTISVDPALTLRENIDKMFKRYQKAGRGKQLVARQLAEVQGRLATIHERQRRLQAIKDWDTWLAIAEKITQEQTRAQKAPQEPGQKRFRGLVVDDFEILVGRSSRENDELTFQVAMPEDFWLHVAEYSGSHVVVRNPQKEKALPDHVLEKAAQLAAYFSQARNSSKVEVHYTRRKFVSKPRRGKPGLAKLTEFKSINVEPKNWLNA